MNQAPPSETSGASSASAIPDDQRHDDGAQQHRLLLDGVAASERLRDEAGRAGAQEVEGRKDDVENDRAGRQPAEQRGIAEMADDGRIDEADQRRRQIGERHRHRDRQDRAVVDDEIASWRGRLRTLIQKQAPWSGSFGWTAHRHRPG